MLLLVTGILITLIIGSIPSIKSLGIKYLWGTTWDPVNNVYGALPFLIGTLLTSFLALIMSVVMDQRGFRRLASVRISSATAEITSTSVRASAVLPDSTAS